MTETTDNPAIGTPEWQAEMDKPIEWTMVGGAWAAWILGAALIVGAIFMPTSVATDGRFDGMSYVPSATVLNLGLLQQQMMLFHGGVALLIIGAILYAAGRMVQAVNK